MQELNPIQAQEHVAKGALLLDVREQDEWDTGHVGGALHIPLGEIPARVNELPQDREILCMCRSGRRSAKAQAIIAGTLPKRTVINVSGGILQWVKDGLPIVGKALE
ncbi:MAG: rhodanese-like domain-containing protein [Vulcanimicrobiaceae bacterium]